MGAGKWNKGHGGTVHNGVLSHGALANKTGPGKWGSLGRLLQTEHMRHVETEGVGI